MIIIDCFEKLINCFSFKVEQLVLEQLKHWLMLEQVELGDDCSQLVIDQLMVLITFILEHFLYFRDKVVLGHWYIQELIGQ